MTLDHKPLPKQAFEMTFIELNLIEPILNALQKLEYTSPTPIQQKAIPPILDKRDILGCAQTGTGKTAAFAIPMIQLLVQNKKSHSGKRPIRALVLTPTRELAIQIGESFSQYGQNTHLKYQVIFGGVKQNAQVNSLNIGTDILIATPGRLLDLLNQKHVDLSSIQFFVLDEADRMLDMGFINDVKKVIAKLPPKRQSLFFSATMPTAISQLSTTILTNPVKVEVNPVSSTTETIDQSVYFVDKANKKKLLLEVLESKKIERALVFTRTKHGADKVAKDLNSNGIVSMVIHGNKSQPQRQKALQTFKTSQTKILVATDIAARGIDIDELTHVINFELPNIAESYVHRIGRTGRAGSDGIAIAFCDAEEKEYLKDIQKLIGKEIAIIDNHSYPLQIHEVIKTVRPPRPPRAGRQQPSKANPGSVENESNFRRGPKPSSNPKKRGYVGAESAKNLGLKNSGRKDTRGGLNSDFDSKYKFDSSNKKSFNFDRQKNSPYSPTRAKTNDQYTDQKNTSGDRRPHKANIRKSSTQGARGR